ncbi:MAG TPA: hypothetical protein DCF63_08515 [Planctomycetaceae bacterium]|nr:hypothetical protein [Planctomycetaceae bacterium]
MRADLFNIFDPPEIHASRQLGWTFQAIHVRYDRQTGIPELKEKSLHSMEPKPAAIWAKFNANRRSLVPRFDLSCNSSQNNFPSARSPICENSANQ